MKTSKRILPGLVLLTLAASLLGIGQGRVTGKVTDEAGQPIEGVLVTLTTPAIKDFKVAVRTDKSGAYGIIVNDATFRYHMKFEKEGFRSSDRDEKFKISEATIIDQKLSRPSQAAAAAVAPPPTTADSSAKAYNQGVDLWNAGDKDGAEKKFQEAVAQNPDLPQAWQLLTRIAYAKKDWAKTLEYGQKTLDLDPTATDLYAILAAAATNAGDKKTAADWQAKYEEANPDSPGILYNKGIEAYNKKNLKEAEAFLTKAVDAKPDFALAQFWLGMTCFTLNKKAAAKEHLTKYRELDPNGSEADTAKEILSLLK